MLGGVRSSMTSGKPLRSGVGYARGWADSRESRLEEDKLSACPLLCNAPHDTPHSNTMSTHTISKLLIDLKEEQGRTVSCRHHDSKSSVESQVFEGQRRLYRLGQVRIVWHRRLWPTYNPWHTPREVRGYRFSFLEGSTHVGAPCGMCACFCEHRWELWHVCIIVYISSSSPHVPSSICL